MSLIFWSRLYAIRGRDWKILAVSLSFVRRLKLLCNMCLTCWLSGWKVRVIGMRSLVFCLFAGSKEASFVRDEKVDCSRVVAVVEEGGHLLGLRFKIVLFGVKAM